MTIDERLAVEAAQGLWDRSFAGGQINLAADAPGEAQNRAAADAADRLLVAVDLGLRRWVGAEGYSALLSRAIRVTLPDHPALTSLADLGLEPAGDPHIAPIDATALGRAVVALLAALMVLLGRIIGAELAVRLVQQIDLPSPRGVVSNTTRDAHDV